MGWLRKKKTKEKQQDKILPHLQANELPITIYLNQEIVFNLIAIFDDGFSKLSSIKTSSSEAETTKHGVEGSIGASNVFAFLGVQFSGERSKEKTLHGQTEIAQERVHTPTSLFSKCRQLLIKENLLTLDVNVDSLMDLKTGDFIEIKAKLRKNPIQDSLSWLKALIEMIIPLSYGEKQNTQSRTHSSKPGNKEMLKQIDAVISMVSEKDVIELVGDSVDGSNLKIVIPCQTEFFNRRNPTEIIDGEFYVMGKVIQLSKEQDESINLLRKTALGRLNNEKLSQLTSAFATMEESGFQEKDISSTIEAPAILIFPIAIYL